MAKKRVFISFDFDHDNSLRGDLVAQSERPDSPFSIVDCSVRAPYDEKWRQKVRSIIRNADLTIVICGAHTHTAQGVAAEITITREEGKPYFLLRGHAHCTRPAMARASDEIHAWNWPNLQKLIYARG